MKKTTYIAGHRKGKPAVFCTGGSNAVIIGFETMQEAIDYAIKANAKN